MIRDALIGVGDLAGILTTLSIGYVIVAAALMARFGRRPPRPASSLPPITVFKPLCGADPELYENLRSFCEQDYPEYQILFGVRDARDPAIAIARRAIGDSARRDATLIVDSRVIGPNLKVSNLANLHAAAKHDLFVVADSDMRVTPDYLRRLAADFDDPRVGVATCLYRGRGARDLPAGGRLPSRLAAMFINEWFLPSVVVALSFQKPEFCFGATMAVRRDVLERVGGLEWLADFLADDYMLGKRAAELGYKIRLSSYVVDNILEEKSFSGLLRHEIRWARTVRSVRPVGYAFSFLTYAIPLALAHMLLAGGTALGSVLLASALAARVALHYIVRARLGLSDIPAAPWLVPVRDLMCFLVWASSFGNRRVSWRDHSMTVRPGGELIAKGSRGL